MNDTMLQTIIGEGTMLSMIMNVTVSNIYFMPELGFCSRDPDKLDTFAIPNCPKTTGCIYRVIHETCSEFDEKQAVRYQWATANITSNKNILLQDVPPIKSVQSPYFSGDVDNCSYSTSAKDKCTSLYYSPPEMGYYLNLTSNNYNLSLALDIIQANVLLNQDVTERINYHSFLNPQNIHEFFFMVCNDLYDDVEKRFNLVSKE